MAARTRVTAWIGGMAASALLMACVIGFTSPAPAQKKTSPKLDVTYEPTAQPVVDLMLELSKVGTSDYVIDLGCGDGRIPVTAARKHGARALCVDLDPKRIREARANVDRLGVADKVELLEGDLFKTDLSKASVITMFLWPTINIKLRPKLLELEPGTRIVSHEHDMGDWRADKKGKRASKDVFLWIIPARIAGDWVLTRDGQTINLSISQTYQHFKGTTVVDATTRTLRNGRINGRELSFDLLISGTKAQSFAGKLGPDGTIEGPGWRAKRRG